VANYYRFGFAEDLYREEMLEKARSAHKYGLLICESCGWSWLTKETATISWSLDNFGVCCIDKSDCFRRLFMKMKPYVERKKSKNSVFYTGRRGVPICSYDTIISKPGGGTKIVRGDQCTCQLPKHN
jgi:hypothetical protein